MADTEDETKLRKRAAQKREDELRRIPFQKIDQSKWPGNVRPIAMGEADGLGIDKDGRLYWDGKPVEIISQRLDLTKAQAFTGALVAVFTLIAARATGVQAFTAYHEWACKVRWPVVATCPSEPAKTTSTTAQSTATPSTGQNH
jgi:hypothetical protein